MFYNNTHQKQTSEKQAFSELELAKDFLAAKGYVKPVELNPETQNIVATADFGKSVNLENLSLNSKVIYEPEQFPGAIIRLEQPFKTRILVFASVYSFSHF